LGGTGAGNGRLAVSSDGNRLDGTGFGSKRTLKLKRDPGRPGHYIGKVKIKTKQLSGRLDIEWEVVSPKRMTGTNRFTTNIRGQTCTITRAFKMNHRGQ
jgi:hypothetical protein